MLAGIDFGSKLSGFTAIAIYEKSAIEIIPTQKGKDADQVVDQTFEGKSSGIVCIDAPISLPLKYTEPHKASDYFYRQCDKELSAMSPMFIGGLTARAMKQVEKMQKQGYKVFESYPKALAIEFGLDNNKYKKEKDYISECLVHLEKHSALPLDNISINNWHEFDALLCLIGAERISKGIAKTFGDKKEGLIYV